jgi:hypothetical protein
MTGHLLAKLYSAGVDFSDFLYGLPTLTFGELTGWHRLYDGKWSLSDADSRHIPGLMAGLLLAKLYSAGDDFSDFLYGLAIVT